MMILGLRTDKPQAELYLYEDDKQLGQLKWQAHLKLSKTVHLKIDQLLQSRALQDIQGIVCFKGPGSFTGLRIGLSVANALAYALGIPIAARKGDSWLQAGIKDLLAGKNDKIAQPFYGQPPKTTSPKK